MPSGETHMKNPRHFGLFAALALASAQCIAANEPTSAEPKAAAPAKASQPDDQRVAVAIYEFRSSVTEIPARGATDMFIDALVHNGQFTVVERSQMNQNVLAEKQLTPQGLAEPED